MKLEGLKDYFPDLNHDNASKPYAVSRLDIAKGSTNLVLCAADSWDEVSPRYSEPNSTMPQLDLLVKEYYENLESLMDKHGLSPIQKMGFLAAELIGMNLAQETSFVAGNCAIGKDNNAVYGFDSTGAYVVMAKDFFGERVRGAIERANLSRRIFMYPNFEAQVEDGLIMPVYRHKKVHLLDRIVVGSVQGSHGDNIRVSVLRG